MTSFFRLILILLFSFLVSPLYAASFDCNKATTEKAKAICTSAYEGDVDAQFEFGKLFAVGQIIVRDYKQAAFWFLKAAEQGHSGAQWALGLMYDYGEGVEQNYERAVYWHTKAAGQGDARAQNELGLLYRDGKGVEQNFKQATYWLSKAAEQGQSESQSVLGLMYYDGLGVEQDDKQAVYWLSKAAEQGIIEAQFKIESIQFEKSYEQLKSGYFFEAVAGFEAKANSNPLSYLYFFMSEPFLEIASDRYQEVNDEHKPKVVRACDALIEGFPEIIKYWENDAPLYAGLFVCKGFLDESLLEKADLENDPLAKFLKAFVMLADNPPPAESSDLLLNSALYGFCPAMAFKAFLDLDEKREDTAYGWYRAYQKFGCPVTLFESEFDNYSKPDQEFAQNLADDILKRIQDNVRELQK